MEALLTLLLLVILPSAIAGFVGGVLASKLVLADAAAVVADVKSLSGKAVLLFHEGEAKAKAEALKLEGAVQNEVNLIKKAL